MGAELVLRYFWLGLTSLPILSFTKGCRLLKKGTFDTNISLPEKILNRIKEKALFSRRWFESWVSVSLIY